MGLVISIAPVMKYDVPRLGRHVILSDLQLLEFATQEELRSGRQTLNFVFRILRWCTVFVAKRQMRAAVRWSASRDRCPLHRARSCPTPDCL